MQIRISKPIIISILVLITIAFYSIYRMDLLQQNPESDKTDSTLHPVYSEYNFDQAENVIKIGIQPLYHPTGLIFEVVRRDKILEQVLAKSGFTIEYYNFFKGDDVNYFLNINQLNAGVGGDMPAISAASKFAVTVPVMVQKGFDSIITRKLMVVRYLRGKKIGFPFGSISHYTLLNTLYSSGLSEADVDLIPMEVNKLSEALFNKQIDAFCAWEPAASEALNQHPEFFRNFQNTTSGFMYFKSDFSNKHPAETKHIIAAVLRAIRWLKSDMENLLIACKWNMESSESFTEKKSVLTAEELANLALLDILQLYGVPTLDPIDMEPNGKLYKEFQFLRNLNKIPAETEWVKVKNSFNVQLLKDILTNRQQFMVDEYDYWLGE